MQHKRRRFHWEFKKQLRRDPAGTGRLIVFMIILKTGCIYSFMIDEEHGRELVMGSGSLNPNGYMDFDV